jgi:hypothetical protein
MRKVSMYALSAAAGALLVAEFIVGAVRPVLGQGNPVGREVLVTNTAAQPVPTAAQGTTAVAGTIQAQQNGPWNVGLAGTPTVLLGNTASSPIPVFEMGRPALEAFQQFFMFDIDNLGNQQRFDIPAGKRLVVEYVSAMIGTELNEEATDFWLTGTFLDSADGIEHFFPPVFVGTSTIGAHPRRYVVSAQTHFYLDQTVVVTALRSVNTQGATDASVRGSVSGYLVDCGSKPNCG